MMNDTLTIKDVVDVSKIFGQFNIDIETKELIDGLADNTFNIDLNISDQVLANQTSGLFLKTWQV